MVQASARSFPARSLSRFAAVVTVASMSVGIFPGIASAIPGSQLWLKRYDGPANRSDFAESLGVSPDGSKLFVTGRSTGSSTDYATVAHDAFTGDQLWAKRYNGPGDGRDAAHALGVSPDGSQVFVTGHSTGSPFHTDYATLAYYASTGAQLWARRYNGTADHNDYATALGVSPDGSEVFVTGNSKGLNGRFHYVTVAYDSSTGAQLWAKHYRGPGKSIDEANALGVSSDGSRVFVTGRSGEFASDTDYATVAYEAATGAELWARRYNGTGNYLDFATSLAVSPDATAVFVSGFSYGLNISGYATVAYDAATGAKLWVKRYEGPELGFGNATALGVSPDGPQVFVTGRSFLRRSDDYATLAYDATTGARLWAKRYKGPGRSDDFPTAIAVSPDGAEVFVTGWSWGGSTTFYDYATVAYDAITGDEHWAMRYDGPANDYDQANDLGVSPTGQRCS